MRRFPAIVLAPAACLLLLSAPHAQAATQLFRIDPVHSQVLFSISHNGFSHPVGRIPLTRGWLRVDPENLADGSAEAELDLAGVDLGDDDWNKAVRGPRLLDAKRQRYAHFASTSVEDTGKRQGKLHGTLSLHGHTVPVIIAFTLNRDGTTIFGMEKRIGFSARARLDRRQFGITAHPGSIGHLVDVRLEIEAVADADAVQAYRRSPEGRRQR